MLGTRPSMTEGNLSFHPRIKKRATRPVFCILTMVSALSWPALPPGGVR